MPSYEYRCPRCGVVEAFHAMGEALAAEPCPHCEAMTRRIFSAPRLNRTSAPLRGALARSERSREVPTVTRRDREVPGEATSVGSAGSGDVNPGLERLVGREQARDLRSAPLVTGPF